MEPSQPGLPGRNQTTGPQPSPQPGQPYQAQPLRQPQGQPRIISDFRPPTPSRQAPIGPQVSPTPSSPAYQPAPERAAPIASPTASNPLQPQAVATPPAASEHRNDEAHAATNDTRKPSFVKPALPDIQPKEKPVERSAMRDILSIGGVLVSALLLAFCLITFVFQSYQVDGPSMQTTLENNDHLIVWKVPKTIASATGQHYIPNRGDVIIFNETVSNGTVQNKQLIKRVLALPGERITVKDKVVTVYNEEHPDGFNPDKTLPYGNVITDTPGDVDVTVGENQVFVCGDNRFNSLDSRVFGPVDSSQIVGKLVVRVLPLSSIKAF